VQSTQCPTNQQTYLLVCLAGPCPMGLVIRIQVFIRPASRKPTHACLHRRLHEVAMPTGALEPPAETVAGEQAAHEAETAVLALAVLVRLTAHAGQSRAKKSPCELQSQDVAGCSLLGVQQANGWVQAPASSNRAILQLLSRCQQLPLRRVRGSAGGAPRAAGRLLDAAPPAVRGGGRPGSAVRRSLCLLACVITSSDVDCVEPTAVGISQTYPWVCMPARSIP
jgi:hypothetical protein